VARISIWMTPRRVKKFGRGGRKSVGISTEKKRGNFGREKTLNAGGGGGKWISGGRGKEVQKRRNLGDDEKNERGL